MGIAFLKMAWLSNLAQTVNPAIAYSMRDVLRAYLDQVKSETRGDAQKWSQEIGTFAIDVMQEFSGAGTWERRTLKQLLGATPNFQVARWRDAPFRAFSPSRESQTDLGVRTTAYSPFYTIERFNRKTSAMAARYYAIRYLKQMIERPEKAAVNRARLTEIPHADANLKERLDAALNIKSLSPSDVDIMNTALKYGRKDEVRAEYPHLMPLYEFLALFSKQGADWMQHRVESVDRVRMLSTDPIAMMLLQLQSFNIIQTKMIGGMFRREARISHAARTKGNEPFDGIKDIAPAAARSAPRLLSKMLIYGALYGGLTKTISDIAKGEDPLDEELHLMSWLVKSGMMSLLGDMFLQIHRYPRAAQDYLAGPTLSTAGDIVGDAAQGNIDTILRVAGPPTVGPNMKKVVEWIEGDKKKPRRPMSGGRRRRSGDGRPRSGSAWK